ncbi:MAG TPA: 5-(carboxyamino)imidazole ribonucleotide mutase [Spirochaetota bacterium]|nr:5-(carboxyamino)imidazole ribonucleotide mutase [Spirochaetota bacterium]
MNGKILILTGSKSDLPVIEKCTALLKEFEIEYELHISSAHRTPAYTKELVTRAEADGFDIIIAAAGMAAHLPGVCASYTVLPVIGIPVDSGSLNGVDALYSIAQMPPGVPVGCMGIGSAGAKNSAVYAARLLALKYKNLHTRLKDYSSRQEKKIKEQDAALSS